jgi:hypothetical protein
VKVCSALAFGDPRCQNNAARFDAPGADVFTWHGDESRPLAAYRPCSCGCDTRDGHEGWAGYVSGSDSEGFGFTHWLESEQDFTDAQEGTGARLTRFIAR